MCSRPKKGKVAKKVRKYLRHENLENARLRQAPILILKKMFKNQLMFQDVTG